MTKQYSWAFIGLFLMVFVLVGCGAKTQTPEAVAADFWQAVIDQDMEKAKSLASWDTVDYLKYIRSEQIKPERYELGEALKGERSAIIETMLYSQPQGKSSVKIPGKTVLISTEHGWRVDLKETIGSTLKKTVGTVFDQLNGFMQEGIKGLDKQLSESMEGLDKQLSESMEDLDKQLSESLGEVGKALEKGAEELRNELSKPPFKGDIQNAPEPQGQRI